METTQGIADCRLPNGGSDTFRAGDWFLTFTGRKFYPMDPRPGDICVEDIVHALSNLCRFGGHSRVFYSVAQHSVLVASLCPRARFQGLMHDATEAYCGDMVRPLKLSMPEYRRAEARIWGAISARFGIFPELDPHVKWADNTVLMTERRDVMVESGHEWSLAKDYPPLKERIDPLESAKAEELFLEEFQKFRIHRR